MKFQGGLIVVFLATLGLAGKPPSDVPVITYLSDLSSSGIAYHIQSNS